MTALKDVLEEEYRHSLQITQTLERKVGKLPKGSVGTKRRNGHEYFYLQWRDGAHVRSRYVKVSEVEDIERKVEQRKSYETALREQAKNRKMIVRALGYAPEDEEARHGNRG